MFWYKFEKFANEDNWSASVFKKKSEKFEFFQIFSNKSYFFLCEIEFCMKNAFFWGIACWNSSKITKFGNFHSFLAIFDRFLIFANFFVIFGKKILKRGQMSWNWCQLLGEHDFWAKIGSRAKIDRGGGGHPPPHLARLPDVALIRVKANCKAGTS